MAQFKWAVESSVQLFALAQAPLPPRNPFSKLGPFAPTSPDKAPKPAAAAPTAPAAPAPPAKAPLPVRPGAGMALPKPAGFPKSPPPPDAAAARPAALRAPAPPPAAAAPVDPEPVAAPNPRPSVSLRADAKTVMVVEDDPAIREMLVRSLGPDYNVFEAPDGQVALEMLGRMKPAPDLLVLDVMMPRMDGLTLAGKLKTEPQHLRTIPIIFLTGRDSPKDVVQGINVGARHYLTKPFKIQELLTKVAKTLGAKK